MSLAARSEAQLAKLFALKSRDRIHYGGQVMTVTDSLLLEDVIGVPVGRHAVVFPRGNRGILLWHASRGVPLGQRRMWIYRTIERGMWPPDGPVATLGKRIYTHNPSDNNSMTCWEKGRHGDRDPLYRFRCYANGTDLLLFEAETVFDRAAWGVAHFGRQVPFLTPTIVPAR